MTPTIVLVEDEGVTRQTFAAALRGAGFETIETADALACRAVLRKLRPHVIILDIGLPGLDGINFARELRAQAEEIGLIVVSRQSAPEARIQALDLGIDDFLVKPVHLGELAARVRSVLRRRGRSMSRKVDVAGWQVDLDAREARRGELIAQLTRGEFDLLARLIEAAGKIVARDALLRAISATPEHSDLRSVDALVSRLRRKLPSEGELIVTAPGFGYRLGAPPAEL